MLVSSSNGYYILPKVIMTKYTHKLTIEVFGGGGGPLQ